MMSYRSLLAVLLLALLVGCAPVGTSRAESEIPLPAGTLDAAQVTALFTGRTVESILDSNGRASLTYYHPGGELRQLQDGNRRSGNWRVREDGRICLDFPGERERCRIIVKEGAVFHKYIVKKNGKHERIITYTAFRNGNYID